MKTGLRRFLQFLTSPYDRILALIVLLCLLASLGWLWARVAAEKTEHSRFKAALGRMQPKHPDSSPLDKSLFDKSAAALKEPSQIPAWSNRLMVAELRVSCVSCRRPIPYAAVRCPFPDCGAEQPAGELMDKDKDGMPDEWELKYGFNPLDPNDAGLDSDHDDFTNLEEYQSGTDPRDPKSHPPYTTKLRLTAIDPIPFRLTFMAVSKMGAKDNPKLVFQLNLGRGHT